MRLFDARGVILRMEGKCIVRGVGGRCMWVWERGGRRGDIGGLGLVVVRGMGVGLLLRCKFGLGEEGGVGRTE